MECAARVPECPVLGNTECARLLGAGPSTHSKCCVGRGCAPTLSAAYEGNGSLVCGAHGERSGLYRAIPTRRQECRFKKFAGLSAASRGFQGGFKVISRGYSKNLVTPRGRVTRYRTRW